MSAKKSQRGKVHRRDFEERFCAQCGCAMAPPDIKVGYTQCSRCKKKWIIKEIHAEVQATFHYEYDQLKDQEEEEEQVETSQSAAGPTVNRKCTKCGNDTMSYATRQTRSADEGMTVFFTCTKCGHKDIEYT